MNKPVYRDQAHPDFNAIRRLIDGSPAIWDRLAIVARWNDREWKRVLARIAR